MLLYIVIYCYQIVLIIPFQRMDYYILKITTNQIMYTLCSAQNLDIWDLTNFVSQIYVLHHYWDILQVRLGSSEFKIRQVSVQTVRAWSCGMDHNGLAQHVMKKLRRTASQTCWTVTPATWFPVLESETVVGRFVMEGHSMIPLGSVSL